MIAQMSEQIEAFRRAHYPVFVLQGREDKGQPIALFDGTATMEIVEAPVQGFKERFTRYNTTHKVVVQYSDKVIGPTAADFFPNRYSNMVTLLCCPSSLIFDNDCRPVRGFAFEFSTTLDILFIWKRPKRQCRRFMSFSMLLILVLVRRGMTFSLFRYE